MRTLIGFATLTTFLAPLFGVAMTPPRHSATGRDVEREIRRLNDEEVRALIAGDAPALGQIWSENFVVTNPLNRLVTRRDVLALVESDTLAFQAYERHIDYIHVYSAAVVVAGHENVVWSGKMPLAGKPSSLRFTAVWMKQNGRWQEVARHANLTGSESS